MITVVSLNPSIDRTLTVDGFCAGSTNRAASVRVDTGGKGINVCLHLKGLNASDVRCIGVMRSSDEPMFSAALDAAGVEHHWLTLPGHVRTNTKICDSSGTLTEINEPGEPIPPEMLPHLTELCQSLFDGSDVVVLTGSIPPGVPKDIYGRLIDLAHEAGAVCLLDSDGDALHLGIKHKPDFIKPNRSEAERLLGRPLPDNMVLASAAHELLGKGVPYGCISLGDGGALFFSDAWTLFLPALNIEVRSTVGAGDAMCAAFACGLEQKLGEKETFRMAAAAGAAAVSTEGTQPIDAKTVDRLLRIVPRPEEIK